MSGKPTVFIDGEAGTTGLQIRARLEGRDDLTLVSIAPDRRKDPEERRRLLNEVDVAVLCLPDAAAIESVSLIRNPAVKVLDASTAHRTAPDWVYGFPELLPAQRAAVAAASRVSNPGCYPTGFTALVRPLVDAGLIAADAALTVNAVSGFSGGGRQMVEDYEAASPAGREAAYPYGDYALTLEHKHLPEMAVYGGLDQSPLFVPAVGHFKCGMLVHVPLTASLLKPGTTAADVHAVLAARYAGEGFVGVAPQDGGDLLRDGKFLDPRALNGTNRIELFVFGHKSRGQILLAARLDNLGKGASGAAVQNLNLMLGLPEMAGLEAPLPLTDTIMT
ncbi:N-acetyl-gamma-glutamyl-phosphate reductase [Tistrella bauzanensis]|nr:N-acetyl-gamma-glutamyl-phosphate reductase [Tistrella bauzanensis]